jgi:hypothetical protein
MRILSLDDMRLSWEKRTKDTERFKTVQYIITEYSNVNMEQWNSVMPATAADWLKRATEINHLHLLKTSAYTFSTGTTTLQSVCYMNRYRSLTRFAMSIITLVVVLHIHGRFFQYYPVHKSSPIVF